MMLRVTSQSSVRLDLEVSANLDDVAALGVEARTFASRAGFDASASSDIELAIVEAATNIVVHGLVGEGSFQASFAADADGFVAELSDGGAEIDPSLFDRPLPDDPLATSGRGMAIIRACCDEVTYTRAAAKNRLRLSKLR